MLKPIEHVLNNPNDVPDVPRAVKDYLQAQYNASFLYENFVPNLRKQGHSEEFISGVLYGFHNATVVIDQIEVRKSLSEGD